METVEVELSLTLGLHYPPDLPTWCLEVEAVANWTFHLGQTRGQNLLFQMDPQS